MDEEDYSRYFTDDAEGSNYNTSAPSEDYSRFFNDNAGNTNYSQAIDPETAMSSGLLYDSSQDDAASQAKSMAEYYASQNAGPTDQDKADLARDQAFSMAQYGSSASKPPVATPAGGGLRDILKNVLGTPGTKKMAGPDDMSKKDMLSMLMPLLLAMIAKNQGSSSGMSAAQEATQPAIPNLTAKREMTPYAAPGQQGYTRPGAGGKKYFSDIEYKAAGGGIGDLGGYSDGGRLLKGPGDGVSDSIPAKIGQDRPARLSDGEFVIPARIVSELGNGSTEAGAKKLYAMMDRVKKARSNKNIAADTKAEKHLPA
jgi:hypothetical protein